MKSLWSALLTAVAAIFLAVASLGGCGSKKSGSEAKTAAEAPKMYRMSELALAMEEMYRSNAAFRDALKSGMGIDSIPKVFYTIHSAQATTASDKDPMYHAMADVFIERMEAITRVPAAEQPAAFNEMIDACVSCHQVKCQGPIDRINKLRVPDVVDAEAGSPPHR